MVTFNEYVNGLQDNYFSKQFRRVFVVLKFVNYIKVM